MFGHFLDGISCVRCGGRTIPKPYNPVVKDDDYKRELKQEPLLTITLTDIDSKPVVHYKGEQIDRKLRVAFDWESQSIDKINRTYIHIEHVPADNKRCNTEVIQHNHPIKDSGNE
ncbi:hypothetical protein ACIQHV_12455 [Bacillus bombysepticus]|uniref:Uncharacterized protein n=1 Tax=Bacillus thuringiensis serovar kumamotoensis TaxID=132267 RepID=A0A9X6PMR6_BACUK|nr:hypothetical protein BK769_34375 [Bacillus thuringiensis serovar kumamtoensis]